MEHKSLQLLFYYSCTAGMKFNSLPTAQTHLDTEKNCTQIAQKCQSGGITSLVLKDKQNMGQ